MLFLSMARSKMKRTKKRDLISVRCQYSPSKVQEALSKIRVFGHTKNVPTLTGKLSFVLSVNDFFFINFNANCSRYSQGC